ncbi:MAG: AAA family ATPase [Cyanobacteria bacterium P01_F01_bin.150]
MSYIDRRSRIRDVRGNHIPMLRRMGKTNVCPSAKRFDGHVLSSFAHPTPGTSPPKRYTTAQIRIMLKLQGIQIRETLFSSDKTVVYRGMSTKDERSLILKFLNLQYPSLNNLAQYRQEHSILNSLNSDSVIKTYGIQEYENSLVIFLEDFGGSSLKEIVSETTFGLDDFLSIGIDLAQGLADIHSANIIHKDINPSNIVYNPDTKQAKLIDFGISTILSNEASVACPPRKIQGTLPYISPEQTGRMNRVIDYRTDFYSLGISLYELLTCQLPFQTNDVMELVHCHIAKSPEPPHRLIGEERCPRIVSDIIMKLLSKTAEDRYQSALGLKADLESCLEQLRQSGHISSFVLASRDMVSTFQIPQKLYGREPEVQALLASFESASQGQSETVLIAGYSGIGKSALVNEIHKPILQKKGYFIAGKFDQVNRDTPYDGFVHAFKDLIHQLLTESEDQIDAWRDQILEALGDNVQVILGVISELELILGPQQYTPALEVIEDQNRFNLFFQKIIQVFATDTHPLVIFLDDLQWADSASLRLLKLLATNHIESKSLLIIGAYRDNEVSENSLVGITLNDIFQDSTTVKTITLAPLKINEVNRLVADTLKSPPERIGLLADIIFSKANGNPFFTIQLLKSLYDDNSIFFGLSDAGETQNAWQWNLEQIQQASITDNVVDLLLKRIAKLDEKGQHLLSVAACIGNHFTLDTLSSVTEAAVTDDPLPSLLAGLWQSIQDELIIPLDNAKELSVLLNSSRDQRIELLGDPDPRVLKEPWDLNPAYVSAIDLSSVSYKFLHDRVQQAAYTLSSDSYHKEIHYRIGIFLLNKYRNNNLNKHIFDVVNHLNIGVDHLSERERAELVELNLTAAKKAKSTTAYELALEYCQASLALLKVDSWLTQYPLTLEIYINTIETQVLTGDYHDADTLLEIVLDHVRDKLDEIRIYEIKIKSLFSQYFLEEAIDVSLIALEKLGFIKIKPVENPSILVGTLRRRLTLKNQEIEDLEHFPSMDNPYQIASLRIVLTVMPPLYLIKADLLPSAICSMATLCIKYGNSSLSPVVYAWLALYLCGTFGDIDSGIRLSTVSLKLLRKNRHPSIVTKVLSMIPGAVTHWKEPIQTTITPLREAFLTGIEVGDIEYASQASIIYCQSLVFAGEPLDFVYGQYQEHFAFVNKFKQSYFILYIKIIQEIVISLVDEAHSDDRIDLDDAIEMVKGNGGGGTLTATYLSLIIINYFSKAYTCSLNSALEGKKYKNYAMELSMRPQTNFYSSLSILAYCAMEQASHNRNDLLKEVLSNQKDMRRWAKHSPENFQHKHDLVEAEKARVLGKILKAEELYEKSIQGAKKNKFIHEEALAYERAGEFYLSLDREEIGRLYLKKSHHCYSRWGATAKVKQMEAEYPHYFVGSSQKGLSRYSRTTTTTTTTETEGTDLDLATILKASQTISSEIRLASLLEKLIAILIENAGAQTGILILNSDGNWYIEAKGSLNEDTTLLQSIPIHWIDPETSAPTLPATIINYISHTQETIVLDDAVNQGQFTTDPYIVAHQSQSILCTPLLNQGQLKGMIYLENNVTTGAFTADRVELLNILAAQAAIAIDNSRLYQTLEQRVEERTKELSQTLDVLKATQAELIFENDLLRDDSQPSTFNYQVGGSLPMDSPTYVVRSADRTLYKTLSQGEFCYVLNARQMGKSSLMVRMMNHLQSEGVNCAAIDMTRIGSENITPEQWYKGLAVELWRSFGLLRKVNLKKWWGDRLDISPIQRLGQFIEEVILVEVSKDAEDAPSSQKIVLFIDEIDSVLGLDFPVSDFFRLIRSCYNQRTLMPEYQRLTFAFFGVATPSELISDRRLTPFNIGQAIQLDGFKEHEAQPLLNGLTDKVTNPQVLLKEILHWTGGQPFLTQKVCEFIRQSSEPIPINQEAAWVEALVRKNIIENWEAQDEPEHLKTIRDRILKNDQYTPQLLTLYQQVLNQPEVIATDSAEEKELVLSGLVIKEDSILKVRNQIYLEIFNRPWIENALFVFALTLD